MTRTCVVLILTLTSPALAGSVRCTTSEVKSLGRLQTLCSDGTRAVSTYNKTLDRWDTTITESPRQRRTCTPHQTSRGLKGRCR